MAIYQYRCAECGPFDIARPIGTAGAAEPCSGCGAEAPRVFTAPHLAAPGPLDRALAAQEACAEEPRVVSRP